MNKIHKRSAVGMIVVGVIAVVVGLLLALSGGEPATGSHQPSEIQVITDDGSSLGQPLTIDQLVPAPNNDAFQDAPTTPDLQQQPPGSDLQQPGSIE